MPTNNSEPSSQEPGQMIDLTRRKAMAAIGTTAAVGIAGCGRDNDAEATTISAAGQPVTARDRALRNRYNRELALNRGEDPRFEDISIEGDDDQRLVQTLRKPTAELVWLGQFGNRSPRYKGELIEPFLEKQRDASTINRANQIHSQVQGIKINFEDFSGYGMFKPETVSGNTAIYTKYEDHPYADDQNIQQIRYTLVGGDSAKRQRVTNDEVDFGGGVPAGTPFPDGVYKVKGRAPGALKYDINWRNEHLSKREVRRALAYVLNTRAIVENRNQDFPVETQDGMVTKADEIWLGEDYANQMIDYGTETKASAAEAELRSAGYERDDNDKWVDEDGNPLELTMLTISWFEDQANTVASQFRQFGFTITNNVESGTVFNTQRNQPGKWDLIGYFHGMGYIHPARYFEQDWLGGYKVLSAEGYGGWAGKPSTFEIPTEVGAKDLSGETKEFELWSGPEIPDSTQGVSTATPEPLEGESVSTAYDRMADPTATEEDIVNVARDICWWWNFNASALMFVENEDSWWADFQDFSWPNAVEENGGYAPHETKVGNSMLYIDRGEARATGEDTTLDIVGSTSPEDANLFEQGSNWARGLTSNALAPYGAGLTDRTVEYDPHFVVRSEVINDGKKWIQEYDTDFTWQKDLEAQVPSTPPTTTGTGT